MIKRSSGWSVFFACTAQTLNRPFGFMSGTYHETQPTVRLKPNPSPTKTPNAGTQRRFVVASPICPDDMGPCHPRDFELECLG